MATSNKKKIIRRKIILESIIVFFVAITPFLYKLYDYFPKNDPDATISVIGIVLGSNGFEDISTHVWYLTSKIIPLLLLVLWFFTSKDWWYHIILIPIAMYAFQVFEVVYSDDPFIDTENIWWLLPVCIVIIPFVYLIRVKLYDKHVHGIDLEAIELEISTLKEKEEYIETIEDPEKAFKTAEKTSESQEEVPLSFSDKIDEKLSTHNLENWFKQFQHNLKSWMHLKF